MRQIPVALLFSALSAAGQTAEAPKQIRLEGLVQNLSGEALSKATLRLQSTVPQGTTLATYTVTGGDDGKFLFDDVPPGTYFLSAEKNGYVTQRYSSPTNLGGATLTLHTGDALKDLNFKLTLAGVVNGRVLDPDGDPVVKMSINVLGSNYVRGRKQFTSAGFALTDDEGKFRVAGLAPGRYYLSVQDPRKQFGFPVDDQAVQRPGITQLLVATYYPSALDLKGAQTFNVAAGEEIQGLNVTMRKERVYTVRAKAVDQSGAAVPNSALAIRSKDESVFGSNIAAMVNPPRSPDGNFEFHDLLPGTYILQTAAQSPSFARREITISNSDVDGVVVPLLASVGISGQIRLEEGDAKKAGVMTIGLGEYEIPGYNNRGGRVNADATFQIANVAPAVYYVSASPLAVGLYVKAVRFGDTDITRKPLDLTKGGGGTIDVLLSPHAADVTGTMRNADGRPVPGVRVSIWPTDGAGWDAVGGVKTGTTDQKGTVLFGNLPPGDYYLAAWEDASDGLVEYTEFRKRFQAEAAAIHVDENSHLAADLKLISRARIAAELAKLP